MLLGDRPKYLSLVLGLAFAVFLITQQLSIFLGLLVRATGPLQNVSQPDLWVSDPFVRYVSETRNLSDADLNRVRSIPGVLWAEPFFNVRANGELPSGNFRAVNIVGIDRTTMVGQPPEVTYGRLEDLRIDGAILVEESARAKLEFVKVGDTMKLNDKRAVVVGYCRAKPGFDSPAVVYTTYDNAVRFTPLGRNTLSFILVKVKPDVPVAQVQAAISALPDIKAHTPEELIKLSYMFILVETGIGINFGLTIVLGIVVGLAVSTAIFYQFTVENLRNFGVLKAMGTTNARLAGMILLQAAFAGLIGYGLGVGMAALFSLNSRRPDMELSALFPPWLLASALVTMLTCVALGALLAMIRVIRLEPAVVFKA